MPKRRARPQTKDELRRAVLEKALDGMLEALRRGDEGAFRRTLRRGLGSRDLHRWAYQTGIPLRTLYRLRNSEGGARFENVLRLLKEFANECA